MKNTGKFGISLKAVISMLLAFVMVLTMAPSSLVFADDSTESENSPTVLTTGTYTVALKGSEDGITYDYSFTAEEAGEYYVHVQYAELDSEDYDHSANVEFQSDDEWDSDYVSRCSEFDDSRRAVSLKAGENYDFSLSVYYPEEEESEDNNEENFIITITRAHEGDHVLSAPQLVEVREYANFSCYNYVCRCTEPGCLYYTYCGIYSYGATNIGGTIECERNFYLNMYGCRSEDTTANEEVLNGGRLDYKFVNKKSATALGKKGIFYVHLNSAKARKLLGSDFECSYLVYLKGSLSTTSYTYNGKVKTPTVTFKDTEGTLKKNTDYTVSYASGRKNVGTYKVTVKGKGDYDGYKWTLTFKINPKGTTISSLSRSSKAFTVKWKAQKTQTSGYQIRYSTSSGMTNAKTVTVSSNKTTSKKISSLKAKKKYYVQIRTYKTVSGKKYYSSWSAKKSVTTK